MSILQTSNGTWSYRFEFKGKPYRRRFRSRKEAERAEIQKKSDLNRGLNCDDRITFKEAVQLFFEKHSKPSKASWKDDKAKMNFLSDYFGNQKLTDISPLHIQEMRTYLQNKGLKSSTVDRYHAFVKTVFNKMIFWRKFDGYNPSNGVKLKREPNAHIRYLTRDELILVETQIPDNIYPYFIAGVHAGMRRGELCNLRWENVDLAYGDIFVEKSKSGKARHIPINTVLHSLLVKLFGNGKDHKQRVLGDLHEDFVSHSFIKICKQLGLKNVVFHTLRHTFASQLVMNGVNIFRVSKWLGHASVVTTEKYYAHLSPDNKREEIHKLDKLSGSIKRDTNPSNKPSNSVLTEILA
ncbi:MAG: hypothetical protein A3J83_03260 [Elusimicrobia bacterium RIFOXYA2_FULL_40_6]|nr:MAG: hypothetical protein A3J83_03260 [Elusimicrobia bacterium RIFOXYA2_FULL_40_6]